ncbi:hypothetical protein PFISCL1PPCAC_19528 [Pristionchus fissidentatus]|uniref:Seipin n=1 Tax=Pristionchus fissidentatus TaxID=1538716 RepID=A0AAV5W7Q4_9BILA|nr:hypothetical protein PFISCL1PPCAC_19528 [Pristionchus fissidentatus]
MSRSSPPPSYHELPKSSRTCRWLSFNRWEIIREFLVRFDRCMLGCMATLLFVFGFLIYILIALSPLIIFLLVRNYMTTLELSVIPSALNSSVTLIPHSFSTGVGYLSPQENYVNAKFYVPIRFQFPETNDENAEIKTIQVLLYSSNGSFIGGGEKSPRETIEVPWIERRYNLLTAAIPVEIMVRDQDGAGYCLRGDAISMQAGVSVHLVSDTWLSRKSGMLKFTQEIIVCCECIFPKKEEKIIDRSIKTRRHRSIRLTV